jgi:hypothetical protein
MHFVFFGEHDRCHFAPTARAALVQRGGTLRGAALEWP